MSPKTPGYKVDNSVAVFNRITSQEKVSLYYGDSTAFSKTINAELNRRGDIMLAGRILCDRTKRSEELPQSVYRGSGLFGDDRHSARVHRQDETGGKNRSGQFGYGIRAGIRSLRRRSGRLKLGLKVVEKIATPPTSVDVSTEVLKLRRADPDYTIFHGYILAPLPEFMTQG